VTVSNRIPTGGQFFEASQTYFVNGRLDWQLAPDADLMRSSDCRRETGTVAARSAWNPLLEPTEQDSRAQYFQATYHKVQSERREWQVQFYHSQNRFDANQVADFSFIPYPTNDPDDPYDDTSTTPFTLMGEASVSSK
jgi:hypothetical protein